MSAAHLLATEPLILLLLIAAPVCVLLAVKRVPWRQWQRVPGMVLVTTVAGAILWTVLRSHLAKAVHGDPGLLYGAGLLFFLVTGIAVGALLSSRPATVQVNRGTRISQRRRWPLAPLRPTRQAGITLAGRPLQRLDETKHIKVIGTTGTGKSTAIREVLGGALARGDRVIIADPDGGYLNRFHDAAAGDRILNPFDSRAAPWDLFGEINQPYDSEQLARALIPDHPGDDRSWRNYARVFVASATRQLWQLGQTDPRVRSVAELYHVLTMARHEDLVQLLKGTPARTYLEGANERMFGSIRSVAATHVAALAHAAAGSGPPLSIRQWIRAADSGASARSRALFLPYSATQIPALSSLISAWLRLAIFETMNSPEREATDIRPLWFIIDELDALGPIDGLKDALARLRKFGGRCVLGFQSIAQVSSNCGAGDAQTIVENCSNTLILRCSASEHGGTAQFASRLIGEHEVLRRQESRSHRPGQWRSSRSIGEQHAIEPAVLASEIEQLPDLQGYLKLASEAQWHRVWLSHN